MPQPGRVGRVRGQLDPRPSESQQQGGQAQAQGVQGPAPVAAPAQGGMAGMSKEALMDLMNDESKLQNFLAENPSMLEEIMKLL